MASLSYKRGRPIAQEIIPPKTVGGESKLGEILNLNDGKEVADGENPNDPIQLLGEDYFRTLKKDNGKKLNLAEMTELIEAVKRGEMVENEELEDLFHEVLELFMDQGQREIKLSATMFIPLPNFEVGRETPYIAGPSGAGKSHYASFLCDAHRTINPEIEIHLFSRVAVDQALDHLEPRRYVIDEKVVESPPTAGDFKGSIVIFDDIDTIPDKKQMEAVQKLRDDLLETGRHEDVTVISTSHQIMNYKKTRNLLNEASSVTMFPSAGSKMHVQRYLKEHAGCDTKMIKKLVALPTRWLTHVRTAPQYILYERGALML